MQASPTLACRAPPAPATAIDARGPRPSPQTRACRPLRSAARPLAHRKRASPNVSTPARHPPQPPKPPPPRTDPDLYDNEDKYAPRARKIAVLEPAAALDPVVRARSTMLGVCTAPHARAKAVVCAPAHTAAQRGSNSSSSSSGGGGPRSMARQCAVAAPGQSRGGDVQSARPRVAVDGCKQACERPRCEVVRPLQERVHRLEDPRHRALMSDGHHAQAAEDLCPRLSKTAAHPPCISALAPRTPQAAGLQLRHTRKTTTARWRCGRAAFTNSPIVAASTRSD